MPGLIIPIVERREVEFSGLSAGETEDVPLIDALDLRRWTQAEVLIRVHSESFSGDDAAIGVKIEEVLPSSEEPQTDFDGTQTFLTTFQRSVTPPLLVHAELGWAPTFVRVSLHGSMPSPVETTVKATISADLCVKSTL